MSVSFDCSMLLGRGVSSGRSFVQRSPTEYGVCKAGIKRGYFTRYLPTGSVAMLITSRNEKAEQSASSALVLHPTAQR